METPLREFIECFINSIAAIYFEYISIEALRAFELCGKSNWEIKGAHKIALAVRAVAE